MKDNFERSIARFCRVSDEVDEPLTEGDLMTLKIVPQATGGQRVSRGVPGCHGVSRGVMGCHGVVFHGVSRSVTGWHADGGRRHE